MPTSAPSTIRNIIIGMFNARVAITMTIIHLVSMDTLQIGCDLELCVGCPVTTQAADATMRKHK
jgi:hypothetical protein